VIREFFALKIIFDTPDLRDLRRPPVIAIPIISPKSYGLSFPAVDADKRRLREMKMT